MGSAMGVARVQMERWWSDGDGDALRWLLANGVVYSATRDLKNAVAAYGEYLASRAFNVRRVSQAHGLIDGFLPNGRGLQIKTTSQGTTGWNLRYVADVDYALVRVELPTWRVVESWLVPCAVAAKHRNGNARLPRRGLWQADRRVRRIDLRRY
jgi:hypothetical protein